MRITWHEEPLIKEKSIKEGLYECIAKTATSKNMNQSQKKNMLSNMKNTFRFSSDQEMIDLYKSYIKVDPDPKKDRCFFESMVLICVMQKLGMSKKHLLEDIMMKRDPDRVLVYYCKKNFINSEFFQRSNKPDEGPNS